MHKLREMQPEDMPAVLDIIAAHDEDDAAEAKRNYQEIGGIIDQFVYEQNGQIIGVSGFLTPPACDKTYLLSWTYVHPDWVNQGHGRVMLIELIDYLKSKGGRKLFVMLSDYVDEDDGAIYAAAFHLYQSLGFETEITHNDFYDEGEAQLILGLRLKERQQTEAVSLEDCPVRFTSVFEIAETEDAYSFAWNDEGDSLFSVEDVEIGLNQVKQDEGRAVFLSFPSNCNGVKETLTAAGFSHAGTLQDYFEDGLHEDHFSYFL